MLAFVPVPLFAAETTGVRGSKSLPANYLSGDSKQANANKAVVIDLGVEAPRHQGAPRQIQQRCHLVALAGWSWLRGAKDGATSRLAQPFIHFERRPYEPAPQQRVRCSSTFFLSRPTPDSNPLAKYTARQRIGLPSAPADPHFPESKLGFSPGLVRGFDLINSVILPEVNQDRRGPRCPYPHRTLLR